MLARRPQLSRAYSVASTSTSTSSTTAPRRRARDRDVNVEHVDLVAPPDPVSNMRPVMYASPRRRPSNSPYSAAEFPSSMTGKEAAQGVREMEWTMMRQRVDMANHRFWATANTSFNTHLDARLAALPPASDPPSASDIAAREAVLTQFYRDWQVSTRHRQQAWVRQWWRDVWDGIWVQARVYLGRWGV